MRIVVPQQTAELGRTMLANICTLHDRRRDLFVIGALLCFFGYHPLTTLLALHWEQRP